MKKLLILIPVLFLLAGCSSYEEIKKIHDDTIDNQVETIKKCSEVGKGVYKAVDGYYYCDYK